MMIGTCSVENGSVKTSKDSYRLDDIKIVSVRRIFLAPALMGAGGLAIFGTGFRDLLYTDELITICVSIVILVIAGFQIAQLFLLSRVTRGTDQMTALFGLHYTLQKRRAEIDAALDKMNGGAHEQSI